MRKLDLILDRLKPINDTIPDLLPTARDRTLDSMTALHITRDGYPKLYAENFTAGMRQIITEQPIDNWDITDNSNGLHLIDDQTQMRIRFLKNFAFSGEIPPAGRNKARNEIWYQGSLDLGEQVSTKHPLSDVELIIVWTEIRSQFYCTAYQPLGPGKFPKGAPGRAMMVMPLGVSPSLLEAEGWRKREGDEEIVPSTNTIVIGDKIQE